MVKNPLSISFLSESATKIGDIAIVSQILVEMILLSIIVASFSLTPNTMV